MKQEDMVAGKLCALLSRKKFASRDIFDLWFFLKNKWNINEKIVTENTGLTLKKGLKKAIEKIDSLKQNQLPHGLGEVLDSKQKQWVKEKLIEETLFYLRLYQKMQNNI